MQRHTRVRISTSIQHHTSHTLRARLLQAVYQEPLHIALVIHQLNLRKSPTQTLHAIVHRTPAINARLTFAKQIQVRAIHNEDFHKICSK